MEIKLANLDTARCAFMRLRHVAHIDHYTLLSFNTFFSCIRLKWVESFKVVDKNEECDMRHLEIVCKRDSVPCNADIIEIFGEDIFPFITFKKSKLF